MTGTNQVTPATGITEHQAADQIASLLDADFSDTQHGSEATGEEDEQSDNVAEEADELDEGSEADDEEESGSEDEEDDGEGQQQELPDDAKVKVGDEEVTLHELKRGFLRQADYTRKTMALADEQRSHSAASKQELEGLRAERAQFVQGIQQVQDAMKQFQPVEPDWAQLYAEDPARYAAERELFRSWNDQQTRLEAAKNQALKDSEADYQKTLREYVKEETGKLLEKMPAWKDPKVAAAAKQKIKDYAAANGFTEQDINALTDHRAFLTIYKAAQFDELQAKRKTLKPVPVKQGQPKTAKPGNASTAPNSRNSELTRARQRLAQTGKVKDAAAAIDHLLGDNF